MRQQHRWTHHPGARWRGCVLLSMGVFFCGLPSAWAQAETSTAAEPEDELDALFAPDVDGGDTAGTSAQPASGPDREAEATPATIALGESDPPSVAANRRAATLIEEIVVTATKRAVSVREIPGSITALSGESLDSSGAQSYADFLKQAPGVNLAADGINVERITIRGIAADIGGNLTTGLLFGDVPFTDPYLPRVALDPNPFDLASVEVLKGPQGTLFGGGALNGAIRYVPQAPRLGEWETRLFGQWLSIEDGAAAASYGGAINVPLGSRDDLALRLMGFQRERPGVIDETSRGEADVDFLTQSGGRAMLAWQASERTRASLMHVIQHSLSHDYSFTDNADGRLERGNTPKPSPVDTRYVLTHLNIEHEFDFGQFVSQTSRTDKTWDALLDTSRIVSGQAESLTADVYNRSVGYVQELRLLSPDDSASRWQWLGGLYAYQVDLDELFDVIVSNAVLPISPSLLGVSLPGQDGYVGADGQVNAAHFVPDVRVRELALFGEATRQLFERWSLTLGLRAYRVDSGGQVTTSGVLNAPNNISNQETESVNDASISEQGINPKLALSFAASDTLLAYASASRGFRFGGVQLVGGSASDEIPETFKSDSLWNYEIGLRSDWWQRSLRVDLALFLIEWNRPQILQPAMGGVLSFQDNVGGARSQGAELELRYLFPWPGLSLSFSGAWVDTHTTETFSSSSGAEITPGTRWPFSSYFQSITTLAHSQDLGAWSLSGQLSYAAQSRAYINLEHGAEVFGHEILDAQIALAAPHWHGAPTLSLILGNIGNTRGVTMITQQPTLTDVSYVAPRSLSLRLGLSF